MVISMGGAMNKRSACYRILVLSVVFSLGAAIPWGSFAQTSKGIELYNSWQYLDAEKVFREALKANPSDFPARYYLGLSLLLQEKYSEALDSFLKVQQGLARADQITRPTVPNGYQIEIALARARLGLKQYPEAWKDLESARMENGKDSEVYVYRGVYYLQQEKIKEAIKELDKAISLNGKAAYAYYYAGLAYYRAGNAERTVELLKTFLSLAPYAPEAPKAKELVDKLC
jgi:tetratricopeptide (TPR) repeat protein